MNFVCLSNIENWEARIYLSKICEDLHFITTFQKHIYLTWNMRLLKRYLNNLGKVVNGKSVT